ncbi:MAG: hypothetical protein RLZZ420_224 [Bacteroidota bacterium]|jgi:hypothetical protein
MNLVSFTKLKSRHIWSKDYKKIRAACCQAARKNKSSTY